MKRLDGRALGGGSYLPFFGFGFNLALISLSAVTVRTFTSEFMMV